MTGPRHPDGALRRPADDAERAAREQRHAVLMSLLAAHADGELPAESASQVEAHLVGCARCRGELAVQRALRDRLGAEPVVPAGGAFRGRILAAVAATPVVATPPADPAAVPSTATEAAPAASRPTPAGTRGRRLPGARMALGALATVLVVAIAVAALAGGWPRTTGRGDAARLAPADGPANRAPLELLALGAPAAEVPLLAAALADYRRMATADLPGRARDLATVRAAVDFPVEPLEAPALRLLAAWTTTLDGEPAAVLAYRVGDGVVFQYLVSEEAFFRRFALRQAAAAHRRLAVHDGAQAVLAWPAPRAGVVLVGDAPPAALARTLRR